ncbi:serine/threonine-protein kinase [Hyphomicrobium sp.]|uniref:WD40 repeat domain-containing serine/threonine protein kinase n=1 Tax=Hyphomicrobium sp. TaxID=82 RepID=UPI002E36B98F|nr:serine/threonine-protein kinase [Hyphomicrobium sp.]HEX2841746.1 serine/threonine-protein kinase [Hyphomicrobium sp.]
MTNLIALKNGTELVGDYRIERVLGAGGFGITYLAEEVALDRNVTIKEYFPSDFAARTSTSDAAPRSQDCASDYRWGLDRFIEEAQTLAKFSHPNIVRVYRYFKANNTAYMVLHFEEGQSLKSWLKGLGRAPRQKELDAIVTPLLDALDLIHKQDFLHRDIAPDNIIIRKDGTPVLIDFGSARGEILAHSKTVSALVKPGYSPYEQYAETSRQQGPWTDIYALAATLYHAVTGKRPADSPSRMVKDELIPARDAALSAYRSGFLAAIDHALTLQTDARPQSIAAWRGALLAPDPAKPGWFAKTPRKPVAETTPEAAEVPPVAKKQEPASSVPPPPDAPGPKGGMLDFLDGLKKKPEPAKPKAEAKKAEPAAAAPPAAAKPLPGTQKLSTPPEPIKLPRVLRKKEPGKELVVKEPKKAEAKEKKKSAARPRPIRSRHGIGWRPILFKLLVGVGVASGAVAMQERFPQFESRGSGETSASTSSNIRTASLQEVPVIRPIAELSGHVGSVTAVAFSNDGTSIATVGADARLKIWNTGSNTLARTIELDNGPATALALFGTNALTGHATGDIVLWDWQRAEKIAAFKRNDAEVGSLVFAGRADRFAASSQDWKVALWDTGTPSGPIQVIDAHDDAAQAVAYVTTDKGPRLASGGADKTVKLWNLDTLDRIRIYRGHKDFISALSFSPDGKLLASASLDGNIRVWSTGSGRLLRRLYGHRGRVGSLSFSPDSKTLASSGTDGQLRIWDVQRGRTLRTITGHTGAVNAASYSPDGERLASAGADGVVRLWTNPVPRTPATN